MTKDDTSQGFMGNAFLRQLPREKRKQLVKAVKHQVLAPGSIVFSQGDPADSFYIIRSGKVRVFQTDSDGLETDLSILGAERASARWPCSPVKHGRRQWRHWKKPA